jgi:hypothetical protein
MLVKAILLDDVSFNFINRSYVLQGLLFGSDAHAIIIIDLNKNTCLCLHGDSTRICYILQH